MRESARLKPFCLKKPTTFAFSFEKMIVLFRGERSVEGVTRLTDHDAIFAFSDGDTKLCRGRARVVATEQ